MLYKANFELSRGTLADLVSDVEAVDKLLAARRANRKTDSRDVVRFAEKLITKQ
jgi:hypothetical protein